MMLLLSSSCAADARRRGFLSLLLAWISFAAIAATDPSTERQTYIVLINSTKISAIDDSLARWHESMLEPSSPPELLYVYETAVSGFAAKLSSKQAEALRGLDGFLAAYPDDLSIALHTTRSPQFLGLKPGKGLWSPPNMAADVIIGVVDTGIWPEHVSFAGPGHAAPASANVSRWKGGCDEGTKFSPRNCNGKVIGCKAFWRGYESIVGAINSTSEYRSARDSQGHGTHTASTAAGNAVPGAGLFGNAKGVARGMRYSSRVAAYKACWASGCASSDILAAVDQAVADGVDVLSLSLGGSSKPYYSDPIAVAAFGAVQRGVFVSCSAGNSGPAASTVSNTAPWIATVAASYLDRSFPTSVKLGDGRVFTGASLYSGKATKQLLLVYSDDAGTEGAKYCLPGSLSPAMVKGKIVLCDRGMIGRTEKGEQVKRAGGAGMLLGSPQGEELFADAHVLPASSLSAAATATIKTYLLTAKKATASITFHGTVYGGVAPAMAAFSSRGPSAVAPEIVKPDMTAPGMSVLAAWPPSISPSLLGTDKRRVAFNIISGTSMSCPHVSGLAALVKAAHPEWSPAAVKSALMTTAYTHNNQNGSIMDVSDGSPASPFVMGSGHVDPERAAEPGLVYDIEPAVYLGFLCGLGYTDAQVSQVARGIYGCSANRMVRTGDLNYPSFSVVFGGAMGKATVRQRRTVTNVGGACTYRVRVHEPEGVKVRVEPGVMEFAELGERSSFKVSFVGVAGSGYSFGELVWVCGGFSVRSPIAVTWQ